MSLITLSTVTRRVYIHLFVCRPRFEFDDFEHVSCVKNVSLTSEGTVSGFKGFIAVGTSCNYNEDVTSRGRVSRLLGCLLWGKGMFLYSAISSPLE